MIKIHMQDMRYININFICTKPEQYEKYKNKLEKIKNEFTGMPCKNSTKNHLQQEIIWLQEYITANNPTDDIHVELTGPVAYNTTKWTLQDILTYHKHYIPENHHPKETYTRMEVNNMLFDLKASGIINSYSKVVELFQTSLNNKKYSSDKSIEVDLHYNRDLQRK